MPEDFDYGEDELETSSLNKDSGLARLSELVAEMAAKKVDIERDDEALKEKKKAYETLIRITIPDLMEELGQDACKTSSGLQISIKRKVKANITDKNRPHAVAWFKEQNLERMLKDEFVLKLSANQKINKGEDDERDAGPEVIKAIEALGLDYTNKKTCPWQTLSAFVRERDAAGEETPADVLSIYRYKEAKIE